MRKIPGTKQSHLSQLFTLHPGDVISTGTPPGVGMVIKPDPVYLKKGEVMELRIGGLGTQRPGDCRQTGAVVAGTLLSHAQSQGCAIPVF